MQVDSTTAEHYSGMGTKYTQKTVALLDGKIVKPCDLFVCFSAQTMV